MTKIKTQPIPIFDSIENIAHQLPCSDWPRESCKRDFELAKRFLTSYDGSSATFNTYRREVERLLQWSWLEAEKSILELRRPDIESYLVFVQSPPAHWIGTQKVARYIENAGERIPNPAWRPFNARVTKAQHYHGMTPNVHDYEMSQSALKDIFAILSSFYNFLIQEEATEVNPIAHIRQKSKFLRKRHGKSPIRRLSELQWQYIIDITKKLAHENPQQHERSLFIMSALYGMYLRISELAASERWVPLMRHFYRDHDGLWWFNTVGKGNKERQIAVSDDMLEALKRYRLFLGLPSIPTNSDTTPLLPKNRGKGPLSNISHIREIVQYCFNQSVEALKQDGFQDEAESLLSATVHWLRHTGISEDVKIRPREHVRDDAGHSSSAITDRYIDIELRERHRSAKNKHITHDD